MENSRGNMVDLHIKKVLREGLSMILTYHRRHGLNKQMPWERTSGQGTFEGKGPH